MTSFFVDTGKSEVALAGFHLYLTKVTVVISLLEDICFSAFNLELWTCVSCSLNSWCWCFFFPLVSSCDGCRMESRSDKGIELISEGPSVCKSVQFCENLEITGG